jgi:hypothetical protein
VGNNSVDPSGTAVTTTRSRGLLQLEDAMAGLVEVENAEAAELGVRQPLESGLSLALSGWIPTGGLEQESHRTAWETAAHREGWL